MAVVTKTQSFKELTGLRDAERQNNSSLNSRQYRDLDLFFAKRSSDSDVNVLNNVSAIKRSVRNLVLTNFYEKPFHPEIGSGVRDLLFEIASPITSLNPTLAAGWFAGYVQLKINEPTAEDLQNFLSFKIEESTPTKLFGIIPLGELALFWHNKAGKVLLVTALTNVGSMLGAWFAAAGILGSL